MGTLDPLPASEEDMTKASLLEYASYYWVAHARIETTETGKSLAVKLLGQYDTHRSARLLLSKIYCEEGRLCGGNGPQSVGFTGLHVAAFLGNPQIVAALLKIKDWDMNGRDFMGRTPLIWCYDPCRLGYYSQQVTLLP